MLESIQDQRIVIIGASSGIGLATANLLASAGAELILANRDIDTLRKVAEGRRRPYG